MKSNVRTRLKTGDEVVVIAGRDVGKTGTIDWNDYKYQEK